MEDKEHQSLFSSDVMIVLYTLALIRWGKHVKPLYDLNVSKQLAREGTHFPTGGGP